MKKPLIYISSPYSAGDSLLNVRCSIDAMMRLIEHGECTPISPIALTSMAHLVHPMSYEQWMQYDLSLIENCDAVVRINAERDEYLQEHSPGADREMAHASACGIPTFFGIDAVEDWLDG